MQGKTKRILNQRPPQSSPGRKRLEDNRNQRGKSGLPVAQRKPRRNIPQSHHDQPRQQKNRSQAIQRCFLNRPHPQTRLQFAVRPQSRTILRVNRAAAQGHQTH